MYNTPAYTGGYYRPNNNYAQRLNALEQQYYQQHQPAMQPIQNMNQIQTQPQASCFFVNTVEDLNNIQNITPNNVYLGINQGTKEIYVRKMNNNGIIELETYSLTSNIEEKNDYKLILEQLAIINEKLTGKENRDESNGIKSNSESGNTRKVSKPSANEAF